MGEIKKKWVRGVKNGYPQYLIIIRYQKLKTATAG